MTIFRVTYICGKTIKSSKIMVNTKYRIVVTLVVQVREYQMRKSK